MSRLRLTVASAIALVLLLPASALAAPYEVTGTVTDTAGAPVAGAEVAILVQGTDTVLAATTGADGSWAIQLDAEAGAVLEVNGTGPTITTGPDDAGCTTSTTGSGRAAVTLPAEGAPGAVALVLDTPLSGTVCATADAPATDAPDTVKPGTVAAPGLTPPSTDALAEPTTGAPNGSLPVLLGLLAVLSAGALVAAKAVARAARR